MIINNYINNDTIIALSTPLGKSAIGIIRLSGIHIKDISNYFFGKLPKPRYAELLNFIDPYDNSIIDQGILIYFNKPNSFTGEDVLEFYGHGNPVILTKIIEIIISKFNIRLALPGEFSSRSFINKKIDLLQSESLLELIESESINLSKLSLKSFKGILSNKINCIIKYLNELKVLVETLINFSDFDINYKKLEFKLIKKKNNISYIFNEIINNFNLIRDIKNNINVSIVGKTNVGKSTLFNRLIKNNKSIVSSIPGTTRDSIEKNIFLDNNIYINLIDTAGIYKTNNILDILGIKKTINSIYNSNFILYIVDYEINDIKKNDFILDIFKNTNKNINININKIIDIPYLIIRNKIDLKYSKYNVNKNNILYISAKNNIGINNIIDYLKNIFNKKIENNNYYVSYRNFEYIKRCLKLLNSDDNIDYVILSNNITNIINILEEMVGKKNISNDILNDIFSKFCIGK